MGYTGPLYSSGNEGAGGGGEESAGPGLSSIQAEADPLLAQVGSLEALFAGLAHGVVITDAHGRTLLANESLKRFAVGGDLARLTDADALWGKQVQSFSGLPLASEELPVARALRGDSFTGYELVLSSAQGDRRYVSFSGGPISDARGEIVGAVMMVRDVREPRELERLKNELLSLVSHELRTPLTTIKGYADMLRLQRARFSAQEQESFLGIIGQEADRLARMVRDILDLSLIEVGALKIVRDWCDIALEVATVVERLDCENCLTSRNPVATDISSVLPPVAADHDRIEQILSNLLDNAAKYSPLGSPITVAAWVEGDELIVSVSDQGPGIEPEALPKVFRRFYRGAKRSGRHEAGLGLGLAICRGIVEAHGGRIWCESVLGQGTTFSFSLPLAAEPDSLE